MAALRETQPLRQELVDQIRARLASGEYPLDESLNASLDGLLADLV